MVVLVLVVLGALLAVEGERVVVLEMVCKGGGRRARGRGGCDGREVRRRGDREGRQVEGEV